MFEYADYHRLIIVWALAAIRMGAAMEILPAMASSMITGTARRVAVLAFSILLVPYVQAGMPAGELPTPYLALIAAKEAVIGFLIGFFAAIPFYIAENVGNLIDNQRGATMGEVYSPLSGTQVSTTGIFFTQLVSTIFYVSGAVFVFLAAIYKSYAILPIFECSLRISSATPVFILNTLDSMMGTTFIIAAPIVILMFLATIGLGFVNRTAPQLNVFFLSMPIKSAIGVAVLVVYLEYIMDMLMYTNDSTIMKGVRAILG